MMADKMSHQSHWMMKFVGKKILMIMVLNIICYQVFFPIRERMKKKNFFFLQNDNLIFNVENGLGNGHDKQERQYSRYEILRFNWNEIFYFSNWKMPEKNHQFDNCCYDVRQLFWEKNFLMNNNWTIVDKRTKISVGICSSNRFGFLEKKRRDIKNRNEQSNDDDDDDMDRCHSRIMMIIIIAKKKCWPTTAHAHTNEWLQHYH